MLCMNAPGASTDLLDSNFSVDLPAPHPYAEGSEYANARIDPSLTAPAIPLEAEKFISTANGQKLFRMTEQLAGIYYLLVSSGKGCLQNFRVPLSQTPALIHNSHALWVGALDRNNALAHFGTSLYRYADFVSKMALQGPWRDQPDDREPKTHMLGLRKAIKSDEHCGVMWYLRNYSQHEGFAVDEFSFSISNTEEHQSVAMSWQCSMGKIAQSPFWNRSEREQNELQNLLKILKGKDSIDILTYMMRSLVFFEESHIKLLEHLSPYLDEAFLSSFRLQQMHARASKLMGYEIPDQFLMSGVTASGINKDTGEREFIPLHCEAEQRILSINDWTHTISKRCLQEYEEHIIDKRGYAPGAEPAPISIDSNEELIKEFSRLVTKYPNNRHQECGSEIVVEAKQSVDLAGDEVMLAVSFYCSGCMKNLEGPIWYRGTDKFKNQDPLSLTDKEIDNIFSGSPYRIIEAEPREYQNMWFKFADGSEGVVDMAKIFGNDPIFKDLKDPAEFADFQLENHTIQWGADRDICNHWIYQIITGTTDEEIYGTTKSETTPANA